jgi:hypothetical protein
MRSRPIAAIITSVKNFVIRTCSLNCVAQYFEVVTDSNTILTAGSVCEYERQNAMQGLPRFEF